MCEINMEKPRPTQTNIKYRSLRNINLTAFKEDISAELINPPEGTSCDQLVLYYDSLLTNLLDKHAPLKTKCITPRTSAPWFNEEILAAKRKKRQLERKWRTSKSTTHQDAYKRHCRTTNALIQHTKQE